MTPWNRSRDGPPMTTTSPEWSISGCVLSFLVNPPITNRASSPSETETIGTPASSVLAALVLVLVHAHPAGLRVAVHDADVRRDGVAGARGRVDGQVPERRRNRRRRETVEIGALGLVLVGQRVPVPPETQHPHAHRTASAHSRRIHRDRSFRERAALVPECALRRGVQEMLEEMEARERFEGQCARLALTRSASPCGGCGARRARAGRGACSGTPWTRRPRPGEARIGSRRS